MLLQVAEFHSFSWLSNNSSVCVCVCVHVRVCVCVCVSHVFLIQSSVGGHLGYFRILAIVNNAAVYIRVHVSF